jgi:hypothetical protein
MRTNSKNSIDFSNKSFNRSFNKKLSVKSGCSSDSDSLIEVTNMMGERNSNFLRKSAKKKSLFNKKEIQKDTENCEDLEKFIDSLGMELYEYICSQKGSRYYFFKYRVMQKYLNKILPDDLDLIVNKLGNNIPKLMIDLYGNYFCQKMIQCCSAEQRTNVLRFVTIHLI